MDEPMRGSDLLGKLGRSYEPLHERFGSRHAELLNAIEGETRARLVAEPCGDARFAVSIAAVDAVGVLAVIAGLFAGNRIDIRNGDVFSVRGASGSTSGPDRILDVSYEALTQEPEAQLRRIIDWCGLPWEASMLDFHRQEGPSMTASAMQVRRPVYTDSVGSWRRAEARFAPIKARFEAADIL